MRELLYVPIIHSEADLGSLGADMERQSSALAGEQRWRDHKATVAAFWSSISMFLHSLQPARLRIYQDGLPAGSGLGQRIVREASRQGSQNHRLIAELLDRGAQVLQTEDAALLMEELRLAHAPRQPGGAAELRAGRERLAALRDLAIARAVNETLSAGEVGVLFLGANHDILPLLAPDIAVVPLKDVDKVRRYLKALFSAGSDQELRELAAHLAAPVEPSPRGGSGAPHT